MADYPPTSRRPIARAFRETAKRSVRFCVRRGIHPDLIFTAPLFLHMVNYYYGI